MNSLEIILILILEVIFIDLIMRFNLHAARANPRLSSAGIISLLILSLSQKQKLCPNKAKMLQKLFLSILIIIFLFILQYFLLQTEAIKTSTTLAFALTLTPIFILPFYHFLFELIDPDYLSIHTMLFNFRLRGATALVLSANIVFIYLNAEHSWLSMAGHLIFSISALITLYSLGAQNRKKTSKHQAPYRAQKSFLDTDILRYLVSIMEIIYYILLSYFVFFQGPLESWLLKKSSFFISLAFFNVLLLVTAVLAKIIFKQDGTTRPETYENRILPLSFLLFGLTSIIHYYF